MCWWWNFKKSLKQLIIQHNFKLSSIFRCGAHIPIRRTDVTSLTTSLTRTCALHWNIEVNLNLKLCWMTVWNFSCCIWIVGQIFGKTRGKFTFSWQYHQLKPDFLKTVLIYCNTSKTDFLKAVLICRSSWLSIDETVKEKCKFSSWSCQNNAFFLKTKKKSLNSQCVIVCVDAEMHQVSSCEHTIVRKGALSTFTPRALMLLSSHTFSMTCGLFI